MGNEYPTAMLHAIQTFNDIPIREHQFHFLHIEVSPIFGNGETTFSSGWTIGVADIKYISLIHSVTRIRNIAISKSTDGQYLPEIQPAMEVDLSGFPPKFQFKCKRKVARHKGGLLFLIHTDAAFSKHQSCDINSSFIHLPRNNILIKLWNIWEEWYGF